jgi:hypothetical protein
MKIEHKPTQIQTSTQFQELEFGIKQADMGLVLEILRSKMYKNPIGAICREIASNSRDANRESENNVPIEIAINDSQMTASDMTISFRDYGPGISQERMADVFVNYGSSTKRDTNEFTGGFGLGAKTPFSYTDNFSIETVVQGIKYSYVAAIEEGRKGKIYLIDSKETTDPTGTTIIVPIKREDRQTFEIETYKSTLFWPMKPVYKNFRKKLEDIDLNVFHEDENFLIIKQDLLNSGYGLLLDGIYYSVDPSIINFASKNVYGYLFIFKFNVGELTISANREALQYDDKTKLAINQRFVTLINLAKEKYELEFKVNTTWLQAALFHKKADENIWFKLLTQHKTSSDTWFDTVTKFNGYNLKNRIDSLFKTLQFFKCDIDARNKISRTKTTEISESYLNSPIFLFDETLSYVTLKDASVFKNHNMYIAVKPNEVKLLKWSELSFKEKKGLAKSMRYFLDDIKKLGELGFAYSLYSSVEKLKVAKDPTARASIPTSREPETLKVYWFPVAQEPEQIRTRSWNYKTKKVGNYTYLKFDGEDICRESGTKLELEHFAVVLVEDVLKLPDFESSEEIKLLRLAMKLKLIPEFTIIVANKNRGIKLFRKIATLEDKVKGILTPVIITQIIDGSHVRDILSNHDWYLKVQFKSKEFSETIDLLNKMTAQNTLKVYVPEEIQKKYEHLSKMKDLKEKFEALRKTFSLVTNYDSSDARRNWEQVTYYINLVEEDMIRKSLLQSV